MLTDAWKFTKRPVKCSVVTYFVRRTMNEPSMSPTASWDPSGLKEHDRIGCSRVVRVRIWLPCMFQILKTEQDWI